MLLNSSNKFSRDSTGSSSRCFFQNCRDLGISGTSVAVVLKAFPNELSQHLLQKLLQNKLVGILQEILSIYPSKTHTFQKFHQRFLKKFPDLVIVLFSYGFYLLQGSLQKYLKNLFSYELLPELLQKFIIFFSRNKEDILRDLFSYSHVYSSRNFSIDNFRNNFSIFCPAIPLKNFQELLLKISECLTKMLSGHLTECHLIECKLAERMPSGRMGHLAECCFKKNRKNFIKS